MGPGQGGSRSRWGWEVGNIQWRKLGPGQGGSQDYFTKKGARIIHIRQFDFHNVGTPFHYILLYTLYANIRRISFLCFCTLDIGKEIPQGGIWAQVRVGPGRSGVGRKEILREVIGPGPGRVPGLFHQKGESIIYILIYSLLLCTFTFCVCVSGFVLAVTEFILIGKEIPRGGKWARAREGPSQDRVGRKEIFRGGHWAQAREGPRTISPKG